LPDFQYDVSSDNWHVMRRVPGSYVGCASGLVVDQNKPRGMLGLDGVLVGYDKDVPASLIENRRISDGLSKTVFAGEALHDVILQSTIGNRQEVAVGDHKDIWYIGSDDIDIYNDASEALASTGVPINLHTRYTCDRENERLYDRGGNGPKCQALQIGFSSGHPGIAHVVMGDNSVQPIDASIDPVVWSAMGTRSGQVREEETP
jgi:hypothetical protein